MGGSIMVHSFDLVVIGTGAGGAAAARKCRKAGWTVAIIDERPFGGTCALRGCDMKKILMGAAEVVDWNTRMQGKGIRAEARIDWPELMAFKRSFIENYSEDFEKGLLDAGIEAFHGTARFISDDEVEVNGKVLKGGHILIATGARPMPLSIEGEENIVLSDFFLEMDTLPLNIVFIGGGMVSMEFAHIAARAGSAVTIIERQDRPLMNFDADLVSLIVQKSNDIGIRFMGLAIIHSVEKDGEKFLVKGSNGNGDFLIQSDLVVHGAGRIPHIDQLNLEAGHVDFSKHGITVNEYLQSVSNPKVYSAGDAADTKGLPLTPVAGIEVNIAAKNLLSGNLATADYHVMPAVVFTIPKIASVGLTEEKAREAGYECYTNTLDMSGWYTYKRTNEKYAAAKIVIDKKTNCVIGAHIVSGEADELVNHFASALQLHIDVKEFKKMMYAYPTAASDIVYML